MCVLLCKTCFGTSPADTSFIGQKLPFVISTIGGKSSLNITGYIALRRISPYGRNDKFLSFQK